MKINVIYDHLVFSTSISKSIKIKDLISSLKENSILNSKGNVNFRLLNEKYKFSQENEELVPDEKMEKTFFLICDQLKTSQQTEPKIEIDQAITYVTGGKTNLPKKTKKNIMQVDSRLQMLEHLASNFSNIPNVENIPALSNRVNEIHNLTNILRSMINNDLSGDFPSRPVRVNAEPVIPDQNMLNQLKDMGFAEDISRRALIMSRNNINRATELLINDELDYAEK